ncbi:MAG TPA: hypothetical protein VIV11_02515 [Kofleriaceae bacterium]
MEVVMRLFMFTCMACTLALTGCGGDDDCCVVPIDAPTVPIDSEPDPAYEEVARVPVVINRDLDLLFVIDDSPSMLDKQTNLKNSFPAFINELNTLEGGLPNVHIGVVTPDLGTKAALDAVAGPGIGSGPGSCSGNGKSGNLQTNGSTLLTGVFISDTKNTDGTRTTNYTGSLASAFAAIASVGASGCGFEQQIEAAKRALNNNPANAGFMRPNASLGIVFVTDEDDCSASHTTLFGSDTTTLGPLQSFRCTRFGVQCTVGGNTTDDMNTVGPKDQCHSNETSAYLMPIAGYVPFFQGLKTDPTNVLVAALIGSSTPVAVELRTPPGGGTPLSALAHSCTYNGANGAEVGDPGVRIEQFAKQFARNTVASVCSQDLSAPLVDFARHMRGLVGDTCLTKAIATPFDCMVHEEVGAAQTALPACNGGASSTNKPCYELITDPASCSTTQHLKLVVQRNAAPAPTAVVVARCRL